MDCSEKGKLSYWSAEHASCPAMWSWPIHPRAFCRWWHHSQISQSTKWSGLNILLKPQPNCKIKSTQEAKAQKGPKGTRPAKQTYQLHDPFDFTSVTCHMSSRWQCGVHQCQNVASKSSGKASTSWKVPCLLSGRISIKTSMQEWRQHQHLCFTQDPAVLEGKGKNMFEKHPRTENHKYQLRTCTNLHDINIQSIEIPQWLEVERAGPSISATPTYTQSSNY